MRECFSSGSFKLYAFFFFIGLFPAIYAVADTSGQSCELSHEQAWVPPNNWMLYSVPIIVFVGGIVGIAYIRRALIKAATWSFADALSEEVKIKPAVKTTTSKDANGNDIVVVEPLLDKDGKPIMLSEMRASTSRVIALMGMIVILLMYMGFGVFALYSFGAAGKLSDELNDVATFLAYGMTLFAPYLVNKFSSLFQKIAGPK